jgi:hypothetical protein
MPLTCPARAVAKHCGLLRQVGDPDEVLDREADEQLTRHPVALT